MKFEPHIIVANEKYGDRYLDGSTIEQATGAYEQLLRERLAEGWYRGEFKSMVKAALESPPLSVEKRYWEARGLIDGRTNYEYENVSAEQLEVRPMITHSA